MKKPSATALIDLWLATRFALSGAWRNQRAQLVIVLIATIVTALVPYAVNGGQALLINELARIATGSTNPQLVLLLVVAMAAMFLFRDAITVVYTYADRLLWHRGSQYRQLEFTTKLLELDYATHEKREFQDELQVLREYSSTYCIPNYLDALFASIMNIVGFIAAAIIVLAIDWRLFVLIALATAPRLIVEAKLGNNQWGFFSEQSGERRKFRELERHLGTTPGIAEIQAHQSQSFILGRMRSMLNVWFTGHVDQERKRAVRTGLAQLLATAAVVIAFVVLVQRALAGDIQVGTLVFAITSILGLQGSAASFFMGLGRISTQARPTNAYRKIMERTRTVSLPENPVRMKFTKPPVIEFRDVSFAYPGTPDRKVLNGFSLTITPGERLAMVGINGAGKSTLMRLLYRFYDPTEGAIYVDGVDLRTIALEDWYGALAILGQDFANYKFTVDEAIALSDSPTEDRVREAAVHAEADPFILDWTGKYQQQIGTQFGGIDPSGGQQQKIGLARALHRKAYVTILDEPTAHMDAAAEEAVFNRLYREAGPDMTVIVISHRFSTIRGADRICIVEDGRVSELGSHDELILHGGTYATLFSAQAEHYQ